MLVLHFTCTDNEAIPVYTAGYFVETRHESIPVGYTWGLYFILAPNSSREIGTIAWKMRTEYCFPFSWEKIDPLHFFWK